jgi:hypothetical protein
MVVVEVELAAVVAAVILNTLVNFTLSTAYMC